MNFRPLENAKWKSLLLLTACQSFCPCHEIPWPDFGLNFDSWSLGICGAPPLTRPWVRYLSDVAVVFSCCCWLLHIATSSLGYTLLTFVWNVESGCKWADVRVGIPCWKHISKASVTKQSPRAWFQASVAKYMRTALFWVTAQRVVVISYRLLGINCRSRLQESKVLAA